MRKFIFAAIAMSIPALAFADAATDAIKARQDNMKARGAAVGALAKMAKGEEPYDAAKASEAANMLLTAVTADMSGFWPEGTSTAEYPGETRAKPEIWQDMAKAGEISGQLVSAAENLVQLAGNGQGEMTAGLGQVGQACASCHEAFQAPKN